MFLFAFISLFLFAFYGVLIDYYRRAWKAIPYSSAPAAGLSLPLPTKISILVPARNEENNIGACLASLSRQSYPKDRYEVIVIDDHSTDRTAAIVTEFAHSGLSIVYLQLTKAEDEARHPKRQDQRPPARARGKKFAIETGIGAAAGELIITTDADCRFHPDWLRTLAGFYQETGAKFIAAPVKIDSSSSFLSIFQTLDFITLQGITGAAVYKRFHSMCNGANLAYEKKVFYEVEGFKDIDAIPSGDDMLLMHKIYKKYPAGVLFLKNRRAIVTTRPETSWRGFVNQRIRWASKADKYDDKRIFWVLLLVYILNLFFIGLLLASWWNSWYLWLLLLLIVVKTAIEFPFVRSVAGFFGQQHLMVYFPALQPFHILYTVVIGWLGKFGSYRWKERKIIK
ncbi:MAG TPA: glycosyltransferase [Puia sp.]|nr:glycosyltransferase [Puia sp.]